MQVESLKITVWEPIPNKITNKNLINKGKPKSLKQIPLIHKEVKIEKNIINGYWPNSLVT